MNLNCKKNEINCNIKNNNIVAFGIQDYGIHKTDGLRKIEPSIYMLFNVNGHKKYGHYLNINKSRIQFSKSLEYFQKHLSYKTDYCYDSNRNGHFHVIVLNLPFPEKFQHWLKGEYSKMYSEKEMQNWFIQFQNNKDKKILTDQWAVLTHDKSYFPTFKQQVLEEFGTRLSDDNLQMEYDFPPLWKNEILRYDI